MSAIINAAGAGYISNTDGLSDNNDSSQDKVLTLTFNQDLTALTMGTVKAYFLFAMNQDHKTDGTYEFGIEPYPTDNYLRFEEVRIIERLFSTSLIVLVTNQAPRKLTIFHYKKGIELVPYKFPTSILAVKLNRSRLVVCSEEKIWIFDILTMKLLHTLDDIPSNPSGLCALSSTDHNPYLAYPGSSIIGEVHIFDTIKLEQGVWINAHNGPLVAMSFDMSGTRIATASNKGTVIRVHSAVDGSRLFDFRRGVYRYATIYSLAFSVDSMFLAASSNTGTIHVFRLINQTTSAPEESSVQNSSLSRLLQDFTSYILKQILGLSTEDRSFATVHLQSAVMMTTIALIKLNEKLMLVVAGYDGVVSTYEVNTTDGGECQKISSQRLLDNAPVSSNKEQSTATDVERNTNDQLIGDYPSPLLKNDDINVPVSPAPTNEDTVFYSIMNTATEG